MVSLIASLALLAAMGALGIAALRRTSNAFDPLEQVCYGIPLGVVAGSLITLVLAIAIGFSSILVIAVAVMSAIGAVALWPGRPALETLRSYVATPRQGRSLRESRSEPRRELAGVGARTGEQSDSDNRGPAAAVTVAEESDSRPDVDARGPVGRALLALRGRISLLPCLVLGALILLWAGFYRDALMVRADGLWASQQHVWSDWPIHLTHTTSFARADNFPPQNPYYAGAPFAYHYLSSFTTAMMVEVGMDPVTSLKLHGFLFTVLITLGMFAFARRLTHDSAAATLAVVLFMLGSGLGWLITAADANSSHDLFSTLARHPWDYSRQTAANFRWEPVFIVAISPTRGFLYGLPLGMFVTVCLLVAAETGSRRLFLFAGFAVGLLPLAHLGALLSLALVTPVLFLLFPPRNWLYFFAACAILVLPQLYLEQGGQFAAGNRVQLFTGWMSYSDSVVWFWLKNLGLFLPLLVFALLDRTLLTAPARRVIWAFMPLFLVANVLSLDPTGPWNNLKILIFWFLAACVVVAALLVRLWRDQRATVVRSMLAAVVISLILSGLLMHLHQELGFDTYQLLTTEELQLAGQVRERTPPRAVFATGLQHNHPVSMFAGRRVLAFFPGYLMSWGIDASQRVRDIGSIYAYTANAPELLRKYHVDYVVVGPGERRELKANADAYRARYPEIIDTGGYQVFAVSDAAIRLARGSNE